jgi:hypothetical protein
MLVEIGKMGPGPKTTGPAHVYYPNISFMNSMLSGKKDTLDQNGREFSRLTETLCSLQKRWLSNLPQELFITTNF